MIQEELAILLARNLSGEATNEEKLSLEEWVKEHPEDQLFIELLINYWNDKTEISDGVPHDELFRRIMASAEKDNTVTGKFEVKRHERFKSLKWLAAAAFIGILTMGIWLILPPTSSPVQPQIQEIVAAKGEKSQIVLPDGTKVWLNGDSKLFYESDFKGASREVKLEGEAFFDVVKDPSKPFIVHAATIDIKVLGTSFNVKAYEEESVETTLYRGLVNITKSDDDSFKPIILYPNQKVIVPRRIVAKQPADDEIAPRHATVDIRKSVIVQQIDSAIAEPGRIETAWMYNRLEFRGEDFETLAAKLERWYNVKIVFEDENVKKLNFNGSFEKENVSQALRALSTANSFNYKIHSNEIFISSKK